MTRYDDATARAKFDACGYGESCEFVKVEGDYFTARCRECGHEFERDNTVLRKPQKKLRCHACYERKVSGALEWYAAGHTFRECADKFGLTPNQVSNQIQKRGVHGGISKDENSRRLREHNGSAKGNAVKMKRAGERIRHRVALHGFDMLDEWRGKDAAYRVRCARCGHEFELKARTLKKCRFGCPRCPDPFEELRAELKEMRAAIDAVAGELDRAMRELDKLDAWASQMDGIGPQVTTCGYCNGTWVHWPSRERYGRRVAPKYCSRRCRRNANEQPSSIGHRLRKHGSGEAPRDVIHLRDLYERDGGICQICGEPTDWNDYTTRPNGEFWYINGRYPTRDHIIAIANGGTHTWDNVQLAHRYCNSAKGASMG